MALSDKELIIQAKQGNNAAFEELIYRYDRSVLSITMKYVRDEDEAKDLYQEIFIRVYRGIKNFEFRSEFSTWLFRIAVNVCLTYKSRSKDHLKFSIHKEYDEDSDEDKRDELELDGSTPEEEAISSELGELIHTAVENLSPKQKITFVLKHYEGYKIREIAEMLDCKEGTVKKYLFDATKNLRKKLKPVYALQTL
jgi:RNA polymerase sigma-70 factor (ECF subfamily)